MAGDAEGDDRDDRRAGGEEAQPYGYEDHAYVPHSFRDDLSDVWAGNTATFRFGRRKTDMDFRRIVTRKLVVLAVSLSNLLLLAGDALITSHLLNRCL